MKKLKWILSKKSGRSKGKVTVRHQGGRHKRFFREIDFKRSEISMTGIVETIEYDPNRTAKIARILYPNGVRSYILATVDLMIGAKITSGPNAPLTSGNSLPLSQIPVGTIIHNIEIKAGKGAQLVKGAGSGAIVFGKEENFVLVKLPSGQVKRFAPEIRATLGQVGNQEKRIRNLRKAGTSRRLGIRPTVRGTAQNPRTHPHGGGEGRSGVGMKYQKTPWGKPAVGKTRSKKKYSDKHIVKGVTR